MMELSAEQKHAIAIQPNRPLPVENAETQERFVLVPLEQFEELKQAAQRAATNWTDEELFAAARQRLDDPEGWGAPEMDVYDNYQPPKYSQPQNES